MSPAPEFGRGVSARAASWLLFAAMCAGVPAPVYLFVVVIAPLWVQAVVMTRATEAMTFAVLGVQVAVCAAVFYGVSRIATWCLRRLPQPARLPLLAVLCVACVVPLCFHAYAVCYDHCRHESVFEVLRDVAPS